VDAINLDGGDSSCLIADYLTVNTLSDSMGLKPLTNAILVVDKFKKKDIQLEIASTY